MTDKNKIEEMPSIKDQPLPDLVKFEDIRHVPNKLSKIATDLGKIIAGSISIGGTAWHVDENGNMWWGDFATYAAATIKISAAGVINFTSGIFSGDITAASGKFIESYTAGETIAAGEVVCIKNSQTAANTVNSNHDTEIKSGHTSTNYGTSTIAACGYDYTQTETREAYINFDLTTFPTGFQKVYLYIYATVTGAFNFSDAKVALAAAAWDESTLTWANQPADVNTGYGYGKFPTIAGWAWYAFDVTEFVRFWQNGTLGKYGFHLISGQGTPTADTYIQFRTKEQAGYAPYLVAVTTQESDSKVYLADHSDYNLSRNVIGFATEAKTADQTIKIQTMGKLTSTGITAGMIGYLAGAGAMTSDTVNLNRIIRLGTGITSTTFNINIEKPDFIENSRNVLYISGITTHYIAPPPDATKAVISCKKAADRSECQMTIYRVGKTTETSMFYVVNQATIDDTVTWGQNNITLVENSVHAAGGYFKITFYTK